jgi:hypothetical protein
MFRDEMTSRLNQSPSSDDRISVGQSIRKVEYMNAKYWFLVAVVAGLLAWAGVETQRLLIAKKQLASSIELQKAIAQRVQIVQVNQSHGPLDKK